MATACSAGSSYVLPSFRHRGIYSETDHISNALVGIQNEYRPGEKKYGRTEEIMDLWASGTITSKGKKEYGRPEE
jgi:hypothetical protein